MTPMSMTYHHHVTASLLREADAERMKRQTVRSPERSPRHRAGSFVAVRTAARRA